MVAMAESKVNVSNIEWKISIPQAGRSFELKPAGRKHLHNRVFEKVLQVFGGWKSGFISLCKMVWKLGADDPRRIFHSIKVGIALALVSLFYFMHPLFESVGGMAVWAVMTVVVIFEFTAGATLSKGLNRMLATLMGGLLAVAVNYVADLAGHQAEPIILGAGVFLLSTSSTFARFFPKIKARYDYGVLIFILTFSFMTISGYRVDNLFLVAYRRLTTIIIGCILCILISLLICPIWAGEDLHKLIIHNLEGLAGSLEGCVTAYFKESLDEEDSDNDNVSMGYKCVLNSKATEESLANFARWEPAHGKFGFRYPWKQYVKIGATMRYCAYCVEALNGCLNSEIQAPYFLRENLKAPCMNIVSESSKVILELAESIKTMTRSTRIDFMIHGLNRAVEGLQNCLISQPELFIDSKRWQIVEETPQHKIASLKVTPPSESKNPQDTRIKKAEGRAEEANKKHIASKESKIWPCDDIPVITDDAAVPGKVEVTQGLGFMDTLPLATVACLLTEIVARLETVITAVDELGERANFPTVDEKPIVDNDNAPAKIPLTNQSLPQLQPIPNPEVVIPAGELVPGRPVESVQVKD